MLTLLQSGLSITECPVVQDCQSVLKWGHELDQNSCSFLVVLNVLPLDKLFMYDCGHPLFGSKG